MVVRLGFGSSTTLAQQVAQGADADLLATAGTAALDQLGDEVPTATTTIARNTLEIATPPDNPAGVAGLADLATPGRAGGAVRGERPLWAGGRRGALPGRRRRPRRLARGSTSPPPSPRSTLGEADAAVVYHSDVVSAAGAVLGVEIPAAQNTTLCLPTGTLR